MPDITKTTPLEKAVNPIEPIKQQKPIAKEPFQQAESLPYIESSEPINPEYLEQVKQDLNSHPPVQHQSKQLEKNAATLKEMTDKKSPEEELDQIKQELADLHKLPPEQLQALSNQLKKNLSLLQISLLELKKQKKVDAKKADFVLDAINKFSSNDFQKLTKEDKQQLSDTIDTLKKQVTAQIASKKIEPQTGNIMILFLAFAKAQMDQNDKAMLAGMDQTKVKTTQLELQAEKQKNIANQSTEGKHMSWWKSLLMGIVCAVTVFVAVATCGLGTPLAIGAGVVAGAAIGGSVYGAANPDAAGADWLTDKGPDSNKVLNLQTMLNYLNTEVQKLSSQLGSTQKLTENASTRSEELGSEAATAIRDMGKIMGGNQ